MAVRLCRYSERTNRRIRSVLLTHDEAKKLVRAFDALRPTPPAQEVKTFMSCFFYVDPIVFTKLAYANGHTVTIYWQAGCTYASNGDLTMSLPPKRLNRLRKLLLYFTRGK